MHRVASAMVDLILPRTDAGVFAQTLLVFPALVVVLFLVRRQAEWRTLVLGVIVLTLGLFGLRTLH